MDNLQHAFPDKDPREIRRIARKFYRHFSDILVETAKLIHLSHKEISRRVKYLNPEVLHPYYDAGRSIVLVSGHTGNWEWISNAPSILKHESIAVYKPLRHEKFNRLILKIRGKYSSRVTLIPMNEVTREVLRRHQAGQVFLTWFIGDQTPRRKYPFRARFFHREVPFFNGFEKLARKFNHVVVYLQMTRIRRGFYHAELIPITDHPQSLPENEITLRFIHLLEETIRSHPESYLWSHRRWKHAGETSDHSNI